MHNEPISSSDPKAAEKLRERIASLETLQKRMKQANSIVRQYGSGKSDQVATAAGVAALVAAGFSEKHASELFTPDFAGRIGFAAYELTNNSGNIRRLKARLAQVEAHAQDETSEKESNGAKIVDNVEANRVQIFFPGKPAENIRSYLKSHGFKWAPSVGAWQRFRGGSATYYAEQAVALLNPEGQLQEQFDGCVAEFRGWVYAHASAKGETWQAVYKRWRAYAASNYDQSALWSEFLQCEARRDKLRNDPQGSAGLTKPQDPWCGMSESEGHRPPAFREADCGGVLGADNRVYSDADSGL